MGSTEEEASADAAAAARAVDVAGPHAELEFRGAPWSTGMVQVDLRPITEAVEKLAGMVRVEARARRSLEAAVETLLIRAGEGREDSQLQDAGVSPRQGGGSLQASVLRLEQEAYRSRQLEQKAIADNEMLQLTVQSLSRDVAKAQVDAQESGKAAAAAAIGEDVDRIQSALTTVSNSTQERIRLLEEKLGLEGADGEPRNGEGALEAGAASPAQRFSGKSPRGYIQEQIAVLAADICDSRVRELREELKAMGVPVAAHGATHGKTALPGSAPASRPASRPGASPRGARPGSQPGSPAGVGEATEAAGDTRSAGGPALGFDFQKFQSEQFGAGPGSQQTTPQSRPGVFQLAQPDVLGSAFPGGAARVAEKSDFAEQPLEAKPEWSQDYDGYNFHYNWSQEESTQHGAAGAEGLVGGGAAPGGAPMQRASDIVRELRQLLGLDPVSEEDALGPGGDDRGGEPRSPAGGSSVAAELASKFRKDLSPWLAEQKGELGITSEVGFPGLDQPQETNHGESKVGGGGFAVTEILAQARREIIQQVRREIAPWVNQQAKKLEGYKSMMVDGKPMANEADFQDLVSKVTEQLRPMIADLQAEGEEQTRGASFSLLRKLQEEMTKVKERVEDVVLLSKRRMNGGFVEDDTETEVQKQMRQLNEALEENHVDTRDHVAKVSKAVKGAQKDNEMTGAKLEDVAGGLALLRARMDLALPQLFRGLDALARARGVGVPALGDAGAAAALRGGVAAAADAAAGAPTPAAEGAAELEAVGSAAVEAGAEGLGAGAGHGAGPPAEGPEAVGAAADGAPGCATPALDALRELLGTAEVPRPFASAGDLATLRQAVDAAEGGARSELGQLRDELQRALRGKADGVELRSLSDRLEEAVVDIRWIAQALTNQMEDAGDGAGVRFPHPLSGGRSAKAGAPHGSIPGQRGALATPPSPPSFPRAAGSGAWAPAPAPPGSAGRVVREASSGSELRGAGGAGTSGARRPRRDQSLPALDRSR